MGSRIAQAVARHRLDLVRALVLTAPLPGIGERIVTPSAQQEFWYLPFLHLPLADDLIDGRPDAVRCFLRHFWTHWSAPGSPSPCPLAFTAAITASLETTPA